MGKQCDQALQNRTQNTSGALAHASGSRHGASSASSLMFYALGQPWLKGVKG